MVGAIDQRNQSLQSIAPTIASCKRPIPGKNNDEELEAKTVERRTDFFLPGGRRLSKVEGFMKQVGYKARVRVREGMMV